MVIPRIFFNQNDLTIDLYNTEEDGVYYSESHSPLNWDVVGDRFGAWLISLQHQYSCGYEDGWTDAEAMLTEEEDFDC